MSKFIDELKEIKDLLPKGLTQEDWDKLMWTVNRHGRWCEENQKRLERVEWVQKVLADKQGYDVKDHCIEVKQWLIDEHEKKQEEPGDDRIFPEQKFEKWDGKGVYGKSKKLDCLPEIEEETQEPDVMDKVHREVCDELGMKEETKQEEPDVETEIGTLDMSITKSGKCAKAVYKPKQVIEVPAIEVDELSPITAEIGPDCPTIVIEEPKEQDDDISNMLFHNKPVVQDIKMPDGSFRRYRLVEVGHDTFKLENQEKEIRKLFDEAEEDAHLYATCHFLEAEYKYEEAGFTDDLEDVQNKHAAFLKRQEDRKQKLNKLLGE